MDDRDDLGHHPLLALLLALPLSIPGTSTAAPDTAMPGEMQALSLGVQVDGENFAAGSRPLVGAEPAGL